MKTFFGFLSILLGVLLFSFCAAASKIEPSYVAVVQASKDECPNILIRLDELLANFGLKKFKASPGLDELVGREVIYFEYKKEKKEKTGFLVVTNIKNPSELEFRLFPNYFANSSVRGKAVGDVIGFVRASGGVLIEGK